MTKTAEHRGIRGRTDRARDNPTIATDYPKFCGAWVKSAGLRRIRTAVGAQAPEGLGNGALRSGKIILDGLKKGTMRRRIVTGRRAGLARQTRSSGSMLAGLLIVSSLCWFFVIRTGRVNEPWDAEAYWRLWYPLSFAIAASSAPFFPRRGWVAGLAVSLTQLPITWMNEGQSATWLFAIALASAVAVPVAATSMVAERLVSRAITD